MLKKIWLNIKLFFFYLTQGMVAADKVIRSDKGTEASPVGGIEQQKEEHNVLKDLLRGEITDEVKELRHEMYYSERKSHEYSYSGGGRAKKNTIFDYTGNIEKSDGYKVRLVQENKEIVNSLTDQGITVHGENCNIDSKQLSKINLTSKYNMKYLIDIEREFTPRFRLEMYATKIVVKDVDDTHAILDLYVPQYKQQFNNISKLFQSELDRIYLGDKRSDILQFKKLSFTTYNCYGEPNMLLFEYGNPRFDDIIKFDGSYVLRFYCDIVTNGFDTVTPFFNEKTDEKDKNHEAREGATVNYDLIAMQQNREKLDVSDVIELIDELKKDDKK